MPKTKNQPKKSLRACARLFADKASLAVVASRDLLKTAKNFAIFAIWSLVFLYILTFFRDGSGNWSLVFSGLPFGEKLGVLGRVFPAILENFTSFSGVLIVFLALLQGLCIMHLCYAWKHRERDASLDGASTGGIGALLGFVALGCPSCGVTFFTPILTAIAGTGAVALTESVSRIFTILAFVLLIYTVIQLGYVNFVVLSAKKYEEKHAKSN